MSTMLSAGPPADSSLETPAPNLGVKHVSWGLQIPSPFHRLGSARCLSLACPGASAWCDFTSWEWGLRLVYRPCLGNRVMRGGEWTQ